MNREANVHTRKKWEEMTAYLEDDGFVECSDVELTFIDRVSTWLDQGESLSFKNSQRLKTLYDRVRGKLG